MIAGVGVATSIPVAHVTNENCNDGGTRSVLDRVSADLPTFALPQNVYPFSLPRK